MELEQLSSQTSDHDVVLYKERPESAEQQEKKNQDVEVKGLMLGWAVVCHPT